MNRDEALEWCINNLVTWPNDLSGAAPEGWEWTHVLNTFQGSFKLRDISGIEVAIYNIDVSTKIESKETKYTTTDITPKQQNSIDIIMDNFNFRKVDKVMRKLKWTWALEGDVHDDTKTPVEASIRRAARRTLKSAIHRGSADSGGLWAEYDKEEEELILKFVLEEWWSDGSE